MNAIKAKFHSLNQSGDLLIINLSANESKFSVFALNSNDKSFIEGLKNAEFIELLFKEHELFFARDDSTHLSVENSFKAVVKGIEKGELLSEICFDFKGVLIRSIITTQNLLKMSLKLGETKLCFIKANDITLRIANA